MLKYTVSVFNRIIFIDRISFTRTYLTAGYMSASPCLCSQVSDVYIGLDLLGTEVDHRVGNFRQINIKTIPVYGMAQPTSEV